MPKITLKPLDDGQKSVEIPIGKTTIGRGPFLGCGDKKVSRNHAVLEVTEQGEVFLTPTHVNPCFFQPTADSPGTVLKKDKPHKLEHGDTFSLLPRAFRYEVVVLEDVTSTVTENENDGKEAKTEEKVNGTSEEKEHCRDSKNSEKDEPEEETVSTNCQQNSKETPLPETADSSHNKEADEEEEEEEEEGEEEEDDEEEEKKPTPLNTDKKPDVEFNGEDVKEPAKEQITSDVKAELPKEESDAKKKPSDCKKEEEEEEEVEEEGEDQDAGGADARTERTLPDWMVELSSPQKGQKKVLKTAKQHRREKTPGKRKKGVDAEEKPRRKRREIEKLSESEGSGKVGGSQRSSSGRSSRTNRQTRQGLSLDDFVASDDDEEWPSDESEPRQKKKRRSRRKDDDSGSDWEIEHKRTKRVSHKFSSGSESGSDWRTNSPRKKKTPRSRRRRSKRTKEDISEDEEEKSQSGKPSKRAPCSFGKKCFRKNASHLDQFSHPGDSDYESEPEEKQNDRSESDGESDERKECPFGVNCYRKNPQHKKEFKHTKKVRPQREAAKHADKKSKDSDDNEEPDAYDLNDSLLNDESADEYKPEYKGNSGSEYESHDVKRLPTKTAKRITKNKRAKRV